MLIHTKKEAKVGQYCFEHPALPLAVWHLKSQRFTVYETYMILSVSYCVFFIVQGIFTAKWANYWMTEIKLQITGKLPCFLSSSLSQHFQSCSLI